MATKKNNTAAAQNTAAQAATTESAEKNSEKEILRPKQFDLNQIVTVRNGFQGMLVYRSPKTGERYRWDNFGDEQDMEISELRAARSSSKGYFENNWFLFDDPEVIDYLGVRQYYKNALSIDNFDSVFELEPEQIKSRVASLSAGQKKSVAYRAKQLIADGRIDSNKKIHALEESLGVELIER